MATVNKIIFNTKTGQSYQFIQTAKSTKGAVLEIQSTFKPNSKEPPAHYHPCQTEEFTILQGALTVKINKQKKIFRKGDYFQVPAGQVHSMWNASSDETIVNWKTQPAMDSEFLFETFTGLANDNKTTADGRPGILQAAVTLNRFSGVFRLAKPPFFVQKAIFYFLVPVALLTGKRSTYNEYLD